MFNLGDKELINLCKIGNIDVALREEIVNIPIYSVDIRAFFNDGLITKDIKGESVVFTTSVDKYQFREIIRQSPLYSHLYYELTV